HVYFFPSNRSILLMSFSSLCSITKQHAYTIVFTSSECNSLTKDVIDKALIGDKRNNVRNKVLKQEIYEGQRLIMASYKEKVGSVWEHAEYRLLHKPSVNTLSPVEKLLNKNPKDGCALFFTLNSPCQQYCTNTTGKYDIIKDLDQFNKINSAAFVFHKVYEEKRVTTCCSNSLKPIDEKVPVYRCNDKCHKCVNNKVFNAVCLKKTTWNPTCHLFHE
uniref:Uncharacterized protein n=1 Tax=Leptobrachium leishanense TaxID=445787 RepID=A0A8C5QMC1_9ANUR